MTIESTQSYNQEISRSQGDIPESAKKLLPRLKNSAETEVVIVTLPEATPVYEAMRLEEGKYIYKLVGYKFFPL